MHSFVILDPKEEVVVAFHDGIQLSSLLSQTLASAVWWRPSNPDSMTPFLHANLNVYENIDPISLL